MKTRIALTAAAFLATMTSAAPHPEFVPGSCTVLERNKLGTHLNLDNAEQLDFLAPLLLIGSTTVTCRGNLGAGSAMVLNFGNTGDRCVLGPPDHVVARTEIWTETIAATGEATLICSFGPRP